jgi:hypothetical protein
MTDLENIPGRRGIPRRAAAKLVRLLLPSPAAVAVPDLAHSRAAEPPGRRAENQTKASMEGMEMKMKKETIPAVLLALALPLAFACGPKESAEMDDKDDTATQVSETEKAGVDQPGDLNPVEAQTMVDDVTLGHAVATDGTIPADQQGDDFAPGDPVYVAMEVGDTPAGSAVKVDWYGPNETKVGEETKNVNAGEKYLNFKAGDTANWPKGDYRAEVWIGDEKVNTQQFQIVDKSEAGK